MIRFFIWLFLFGASTSLVQSVKFLLIKEPLMSIACLLFFIVSVGMTAFLVLLWEESK